ncbi:MAG: glycosyltransferase [Pseudobacteriovorax sp.]|nr:glycosyltransferase [Pseudobacteriovorax sp.]
MANSPKVTVYIANHNYQEFIEKSILSVLSQTMQDFELIIIDDGSTDNSKEIIEKHLDHPKVTAIFQKNNGLNITNNIAIRASSGEYIMRLDADDYLDSHALAILSSTLDRSPETGLVFPDYYLIGTDESILGIQKRHDFDAVKLKDQPAHGACTMIRKKLLEEIGGYDESYKCQDGFDLWIRSVKRYDVKNINLPLFYYRQHPTSLSKNEEKIHSTRSKILKKNSKKPPAHRKIAAIIPVRGMERETPFVLRKINGTPLIDWVVNQALNAETIDKVAVSTPDHRIQEYLAFKYGQEVIIIDRSKDLAAPNTLIDETIKNAVAQLEQTWQKPDILAILYAENPFRRSRYIDDAVRVMDFFEVDSVLGVRPEDKLLYKHRGAGLTPINSKQGLLRLEREELYKAVGGLSVVKEGNLGRFESYFGEKVGHVVLDQQSSLEIGSEWDWKMASLIAEEVFEPGSHSRPHSLQSAKRLKRAKESISESP